MVLAQELARLGHNDLAHRFGKILEKKLLHLALIASVEQPSRLFEKCFCRHGLEALREGLILFELSSIHEKVEQA